MKKPQGNNKKGLIIAIAVLSALLAVLIGFVIHMENRSEAPSGMEETTSPEMTAPQETDPEQMQTLPPQMEETAPAEEESQTESVPLPTELVVTTPYCTLYYPAEWSSRVRAEAEATAYGYIVTFCGAAAERDVELFTVYFAEAGENSFPVGMIRYGETVLDVCVELSGVVPDGSWDDQSMDDISAMQEGINYLIDRLEENPAFTPVSQMGENEPAEETEPAPQDLVATTPYCDLYFPAQWKDAVSWEGRQTEIGYIAVFYGTVNGKKAELFTLYFAESGEDSIPIGIYTADDITVDVSLTLPKLPDDLPWSESEKNLFYALQENVNYLMEKLKEDPAFLPIES